MKRAPIALTLALFSALPLSAFAQAYVGVGLGQSDAHIDCSGTTSCKKTDTAAKVFGGYMFTPNVGLEAAYYDQGKATLTATDPELGNLRGEFKGDGVGVYALGVLPFGDASVFVRLGVVSANITGTATASSLGSASLSERHSDLAVGLGAGYKISSMLGARLEYERVRVKFQGTDNNVDLFTLSLLYSF